jgi:3-dehydroquinate synthase class II
MKLPESSHKMTKNPIKIRAILALLLVSMGGTAASAKTLYVQSTSASDVAVELGEIKSITFGDQNVTIELTNNNTVECATSTFKAISTTKSGEQSAVDNISVAKAEQWTVYDLKGNCLGTVSGVAKDDVTLSGNLAKGVYIVKSESETLKLIVR